MAERDDDVRGGYRPRGGEEHGDRFGAWDDERERASARTGRDRGWDQPLGRVEFEPDPGRERLYGASPGGFARSQGYGSWQRGYENSLHDAGPDRDRGGWDRTSRSYGYRPAAPRPGEPNYAGRGPKNWKRSDDRIMEDVSDLLERHPGVDASDIEVRVRDGVVILEGTVPQREMKRMAEDVIESVAGVHDVENHVRVARDIGFSTNADGLVVQGASRATRGSEPGTPSARPAQAGTPAEARGPAAPRAGTEAGTPAEARGRSPRR